MSSVDGWVLEGCSGAVGRNGLRADQMDSPARIAGVLADSPLRVLKGQRRTGVVVFLMGYPARADRGMSVRGLAVTGGADAMGGGDGGRLPIWRGSGPPGS